MGGGGGALPPDAGGSDSRTGDGFPVARRAPGRRRGATAGRGSTAVATPCVRVALLRNRRDPGKRPGQADPPPSYNAGEKLHSRGENPAEGPSCCPGQRRHRAETPRHTRAGAIRAGFGRRAAAATPGCADNRAAPGAASLRPPPAAALRKGPGPSSGPERAASLPQPGRGPAGRSRRFPASPASASPPPPVSYRGGGGRGKAMGEREEKTPKK